MAECTYRSKNGNYVMKIEFATQKELFSEVAALEEVFGISKCDACDSDNIRPSTRTVDEFVFYEFVCNDCGCRLQLGQNKKGGGLFPKRDGAGKNGWAKPDFAPKQAPQKPADSKQVTQNTRR